MIQSIVKLISQVIRNSGVIDLMVPHNAFFTSSISLYTLLNTMSTACSSIQEQKSGKWPIL
ncbi:hypothetical protein PAXRUDRAFT_781731 [Paxillus rubicundulus Ve08.2h10]|uniref:Uncharacterized protein n=1 Tax=Paxillus rubicundulus Ve08.2h10 TaxID=930991 RepID=A0A0D0BZB8_9AGAM|nr:hypothetical protein PAXRUDRAFT_781731 [Paxillus rubicundulus Ve08.2h10]